MKASTSRNHGLIAPARRKYLQSRISETGPKTQPEENQFIFFSKLPPEIRAMIWKRAYFIPPRYLELRICKFPLPKLCVSQPPRILSLVNKESEYEARGTPLVMEASNLLGRRVAFHHGTDIIYIVYQSQHNGPLPLLTLCKGLIAEIRLHGPIRRMAIDFNIFYYSGRSWDDWAAEISTTLEEILILIGKGRTERQRIIDPGAFSYYRLIEKELRSIDLSTKVQRNMRAYEINRLLVRIDKLLQVPRSKGKMLIVKVMIMAEPKTQ